MVNCSIPPVDIAPVVYGAILEMKKKASISNTNAASRLALRLRAFGTLFISDDNGLDVISCHHVLGTVRFMIRKTAPSAQRCVTASVL